MLQDKVKVMLFVRQMSTFTPFAKKVSDGWDIVNKEKTVTTWMGHSEQREDSIWMGHNQQREDTI